MLDFAKDLLGPDGGKLALAFAAGCAATYGFVRLVLMEHLYKQIEMWKENASKCEAQVVQEKVESKEDLERYWERIKQLETLLLFEAIGNSRQQAQKAISESHLGETIAAQIAAGHIKPGGGSHG